MIWISGILGGGGSISLLGRTAGSCRTSTVLGWLGGTLMEEVLPTPPKGLLRHLTSGPAWGLETLLPILGRTARSCRTGTVLGWLETVLPILGRTAKSCRTGTVLGWLGAVLPILGRTAGSCRTGTVLGWLGRPPPHPHTHTGHNSQQGPQDGLVGEGEDPEFR